MTGPATAPRDLSAMVAAICSGATGVHGDVRDVVSAQVDRVAPLATVREREALITQAVARLDGLDLLETHLVDPDVDEVMVNAGREVWIDRHGVVRLAGHLPAGAIDVVLERVLAPTGRRIDRTNPIVDVRLASGARLCAVVEPVAVDGTCVSIRQHRARRFAIEHFVDDPQVGAVLDEVVATRCNLLVSGATSSGKTTFAAALLRHIDASDRLVVCEDTTELDLGDRHAVRLESRGSNADGVRAIDLAALVRAALRLRPDRLVVGEFRGTEVLAAVDAMNTGHDGSLSTCHANSAVDALRRVETLLMQAAPAWPLAAIRRQVSRSIDVVVHLERTSSGDRRVAEVAEVVESDGEPTVRTLADNAGRHGALSRRRRAGAR
jgi:pilus assembly protein CpaF